MRGFGWLCRAGLVKIPEVPTSTSVTCERAIDHDSDSLLSILSVPKTLSAWNVARERRVVY